MEQGVLYVCATPIGNLEDLTYRVVRILKEVDLIAAEDTRNSRKLLSYLDIHTPMTSYHEHNRYEKAQKLTEELRAGRSIALVTDAGMPAISDPGQVLVDLCHREGIRVTVLPGACALTDALALSGLDTRGFCFEGFLPHDKKERDRALERLGREERTTVFYEAPHRLKKTLELLMRTLGGSRRMAVCRELTKKHEEVFRDTVSNCLRRYEEEEPRGEFVLVIEGISRAELDMNRKQSFEGVSAADHLEMYISSGMDKKEAMKAVAKDLGISRREVYAALEREKEDNGDQSTEK